MDFASLSSLQMKNEPHSVRFLEAFIPRPLLGVHFDAAAELAPAMAANITQRGGGYDREDLQDFQHAAGIPSDGYYGPHAAGALECFLRSYAPEPLYGDQGKVAYQVPMTPPLAQLIGRCLCHEQGAAFVKFMLSSKATTIFSVTASHDFSSRAQLDAARYLSDYVAATPPVKGVWIEAPEHAIYRACAQLDVPASTPLTPDYASAFEYIASIDRRA
jgi:hypothetical protein